MAIFITIQVLFDVFVLLVIINHSAALNVIVKGTEKMVGELDDFITKATIKKASEADESDKIIKIN